MRQLSRLAGLPLQRHAASAWTENAKVLHWSRRFSAISAAQVKELREKTGASMGKSGTQTHFHLVPGSSEGRERRLGEGS
eukprot:s299_g8.t1